MTHSLTSAANIDNAFLWVCEHRQNYPPNADIWDLRFHWNKQRGMIIDDLKSGNYRFKPLQIIIKQDGTSIALWGAMDALVIKAMTNVLEDILPSHKLCEHTKGHGGGKASALRAEKRIISNDYKFVCRTDIKGYYSNIDKTLLLSQLGQYVACNITFDLLVQFIHYSVEQGGVFHTPTKGISRGSSLSPLLAAFHLYTVDAHFSDMRSISYTRYMDDFLILAKTRWHLRKAIKKLNQFFNRFSFVQHPDKTFIGKIDKGFDWMGFQFTLQGIVDIAPRSMEKLIIKLAQLYEQHQPLTPIERALKYFSHPNRKLQIDPANTIGPKCRYGVTTRVA